MANNVSTVGCMELEHQRETVDLFFPSCWASQELLLCKRLADGAAFKFLYHRSRRLLYRIDRDLINGRPCIGLHWVESTRYNARYRIADGGFRGGRAVPVPQAGGGTQLQRFEYGQAVSKKKSRPGRELFRATHIDPGQCPEWWDIFNFMP